MTELTISATGRPTGQDAAAGLPANQHERLFLVSPSLLCIAGMDGYFKMVNPAFHKALGHTEAELLARPFIEFVHPDDRESTRSEVSKLTVGVPAINFENRYRHADGSYHWLLWNAVPVPEEELLYASALDITENKEAYESHRELLNAVPDSFIIADRHGTILEANRATETLFGYANDELAGQSIEILVPTRYRDTHRQHRNSYVTHPRTRLMGDGIELTGMRKDGSEFPAEISLQPAGSEEDRKVICAVRDISMRLQTKRDLLKSERKVAEDERKLQALAGRLVLAEENVRRNIARGLHDDVGQALLAVKMSVEALLENDRTSTGELSTGETLHILDSAIRSTRELTFELASAALYDVGLGAALQSLCEQAQRRSGIQFHPPENVPDKPIPEEMRIILYRACRELIQNVVKHSGARSARLTLSVSDNLIRLAVEDDGCGFDIASLDTQKARISFGLFSIDQQLRPIGGSLEISSVTESGTRAELSVPLAAGDEGG